MNRFSNAALRALPRLYDSSDDLLFDAEDGPRDLSRDLSHDLGAEDASSVADTIPGAATTQSAIRIRSFFESIVRELEEELRDGTDEDVTEVRRKLMASEVVDEVRRRVR